MADTITKHEWLRLESKRSQPYTLEDVSVIIPSTAQRFNNRLKWFWPQYVGRTEAETIRNTIIPCDPSELDDLKALTKGRAQLVPTEPRFIVNKTLSALETIRTRLTFRLANDIMIVRKGWEKILIDQFNAEEKLQIIGELQNGISFPQSHRALQEWSFFQKEYSKETTAAEYIHGARLFAQTSVWRGYYSLVQRYTRHDHDEVFFTQLARGDGTVFTNFKGINLYLAHVGITNQDFTDEYIAGHISDRRRELESAEDKHMFVKIR